MATSVLWVLHGLLGTHGLLVALLAIDCIAGPPCLLMNNGNLQRGLFMVSLMSKIFIGQPNATTSVKFRLRHYLLGTMPID